MKFLIVRIINFRVLEVVAEKGKILDLCVVTLLDFECKYLKFNEIIKYVKIEK